MSLLVESTGRDVRRLEVVLDNHRLANLELQTVLIVADSLLSLLLRLA